MVACLFGLSSCGLLWVVLLCAVLLFVACSERVWE